MTPTDTILEVFRAIEERDLERFVGLCAPEVELVWPPTLPYATAASLDDEIGPALAERSDASPSWIETWDPLQPSGETRRMDPRVVGELGHNVVVLWHQRGVDSAGRRIDEVVLGLYEISNTKLVRGQMFYFNPARVGTFLADAGAA